MAIDFQARVVKIFALINDWTNVIYEDNLFLCVIGVSSNA